MSDTRPSWMHEANCFGVDPDLMFPGRGDTATLAAAREVCAGCVVRPECLEHALTRGEKYGVWAGTSERERRRIRIHRRLTGTGGAA
jgi:WhiB family redox-sensing transcriptional regulator